MKGFNTFDPKSEAKWYEFNEMKFLIGPIFGTKYQTVLNKQFNWADAEGIDKKGASHFDTLTIEESTKKLYKLYAEALVLDWQDVTLNGVAKVFDQNEVCELMCEHSDFSAFVMRSSIELRKAQIAEKEKIVKN